MLWQDEGTVMMEYVILNLCFWFVLVLAGFCFLPGDTAGQPYYSIDPATGAVTEEGVVESPYGRLGGAFLERYDLTVAVISMPFP